MTDPWRLDVCDVRDAVASSALSVNEVVESCLKRVAEVEGAAQAWAFHDAPVARAAAASARPEGPLYGVPVGVKDIFNTSDMPTAMGSATWEGFTPGNDARIVFNARRAGCVVLGKTVTAEFAVHAPGRTRNPWDSRRTPGTSSSGSSVAVATGMVPWALGSQTAGSVIRPASYAGVYGYKPSFGVLPRTGMLKTTDTLDQIGYFARSGRDLSPLLSAIRLRGRDYPLIQRSLDADEGGAPGRDSAPRIGLVTDSLWTWERAQPEARDHLARFADRLAAAGCAVEEASAPTEMNRAHDVHATIYERSLAYYFAQEAQRQEVVSGIMLEMVERGRRVSMAQLTQALDEQLRIQGAFSSWAAEYDVLATLSTAGVAPLLGEDEPPDPSLVWSLCGAPACSVPAMTSGGLPIGVQLVAPWYADYRLLRVVEWLEATNLVGRVAAFDPVEQLVA